MQCIKTTQKALYANIQESPSYEGALESIGSLATKFLADVETAQKEIQDKREEAKKEEEQLKTTQWKWFGNFVATLVSVYMTLCLTKVI